MSVPLERGMNTLWSRHKQCHFNFTTSPLYLVKLTIAADHLLQCVLFICWTDCFKLSQKVVQCSIRFFFSLLENSFSNLLAENILNSPGFCQKFIFRLNMVNFSMWTTVKMWFATYHSYDVIKQLSKWITLYCGVFIPLSTSARTIKIDQEMREL